MIIYNYFIRCLERTMFIPRTVFNNICSIEGGALQVLHDGRGSLLMRKERLRKTCPSLCSCDGDILTSIEFCGYGCLIELQITFRVCLLPVRNRITDNSNRQLRLIKIYVFDNAIRNCFVFDLYFDSFIFFNFYNFESTNI